MSTATKLESAMRTVHNVIVVANPSHATPAEHSFWTAVATHLADQGWLLVEIAMRRLPHSPPALTLSLPARLSDLNHSLQALPLVAGRATSQLPWWSAEDFVVQEDWEYRRWGVEERLPATLLGLMRLASFVESSLDALCPALVLTLNKIDHNVVQFRHAARWRGIPAWVVERSPLDGIWLEPDGLFAESKIWNRYSFEEALADKELAAMGRRERARLAANPKGFRDKQTASSELDRIRALPRPHVFLPMDNVLWTGWAQPHHPMNRLDNPLYPSPAAAMQDLQVHVDAMAGSLLVKPHPACREINEASMPDGVHFVTADLAALIQTADVVCCFNTKVAFPALALNKPVLTLAPNPVAASGATYHCQHRSEVAPALAAALEGDGLDERLARFVPFLGWLSRDYLFSCNEPEPPRHLGPASFARTLIEIGAQPLVELTASQLDAVVSKLAITARARRPSPDSLGPSPPPPAPLSMMTKGLSTLIHRGPMELGRRALLRAVARLGTPRIRWASAFLEKIGVNTGELMARFPYLVTYRKQAPPLLRPVHEIAAFVGQWERGLGPHSSLHHTGCSPEQLRRWANLKGRYSAQRLWVVSADTPVRHWPRSVLCREATLLLGSPQGLPQHWQPTFHLTLAEGDHGLEMPSVRQATFLPQRLRGFTKDVRPVFWFGPPDPRTDDGESFSDDPREGIHCEYSPFEAAAQIAAFLGFNEVCFVTASQTGMTTSRLAMVAAALRRRNIELRLVKTIDPLAVSCAVKALAVSEGRR